MNGKTANLLNEKTLGIIVLGLMKYYPIDYGTTGA